MLVTDRVFSPPLADDPGTEGHSRKSKSKTFGLGKIIKRNFAGGARGEKATGADGAVPRRGRNGADDLGAEHEVEEDIEKGTKEKESRDLYLGPMPVLEPMRTGVVKALQVLKNHTISRHNFFNVALVSS